MPVTFDNAGNTAQTSTVSFSLTFTVGANAVLLASICMQTTNGSISAVAYAGAPLTQLARIEGPNSKVLLLWGLTAPASGANTLSIARVGVAGLMQAVATSYLNAKAVSPFGTVVTGSHSVTATIVINIPSSANDLVMGVATASTLLSANNATTRFTGTGGTPGFVVGDAAGAASISMSITCIGGTSSGSFLGVNIAFSAVAATSLRLSRMLTGIGY